MEQIFIMFYRGPSLWDTILWDKKKKGGARAMTSFAGWWHAPSS